MTMIILKRLELLVTMTLLLYYVTHIANNKKKMSRIPWTAGTIPSLDIFSGSF